MKLARASLIVSYGLFTIAAQTLLFREFTTAFEGNDISVGVFFGSWFLWVGAGAMLVRRWGRLAESLLRHVELLFLVYIPALAVQLLLTVRVRELAGLASYDLMSVQAIVFWSLLVNAPLSLVTGLLFPLACRWVERTQSFPISHVYVLEAAGSFVGGVAVTVLLALHVDTVRILFLMAIVLSLPVLAVRLADVRMQRGSRVAAWLVPSLLIVLPVFGLAGGVDGVLAHRLRLLKWSRLLPADAYRGALHTAQAEYLYGEYRGQWVVVRDGAACETLPNLEAGGQTAAVSLCQKPDAKRVLIVGSGLALCERFLSLPQVERVAWAYPDSEYVASVQQHLPAELRIDDDRFRPITQELRGYLATQKDRFDIVIVHLPGVTGSAFNRYFTAECFARIKASLAPGGVLSVSVAGGENVMGAELAGLGASVKLTLESVFSHLVVVPGDETWLLASDSPSLTGDPAVLRDRLATVKGAEHVFPPAGLLSIYLPDRAEQVLKSYDKVDLPGELLLNRDVRPLTHLYSLLLAARQSGASMTRLVNLLALGGLLPFLTPILVFAILRAWSVAGNRGESRSSFDSSFLVFSAGWIGIAVLIVLMYLYETRFGSLYLHVGLISSLFMAGLTVGAVFIGRLIRRASEGRSSLHWVLTGLIVFHGLVLAGIALGFAGGQAGHALFAAAFVVTGLCCGGYWPLAAARIAAAGFHPGQAGSRLETADHLGACLGGLSASLLMVPVLGAGGTLLVLIGLLLANLPASVSTLWRRESEAFSHASTSWLRGGGYTLFGVAACIVIISNLLTAAEMRRRPTLPDYAVQALAGSQDTQEATVTLPDGGRRVRYFALSPAGGPPTGYILSTADFAPAVRGFGGRINLATHIDSNGTLVDFLVVQSNETPAYFDLLQGWLSRLKGRQLFMARPFAGIDTVTGATISSEAVLEALEESSRQFAAQVLGKGQPVAPAPAFRLPDGAVVYLPVVLAAALLVTLRGGFHSRLAVLVLTLVAGGVALNAQYSIEQVVSLLSLDVPVRLSVTLLLVLGVPLLVVLFGNLYCGYLCPFGAAQELLGYVLPKRFKPADPGPQMRAARYVRYAVLFVLIATFFLSRSRTTLSADPLISVFRLGSSPVGSVRTWFLAAAALTGSLFVVRFWCRYLCPAGAFLSLLNRVALLRRWLPARWFARCEFGLTVQERSECICCDRCRYPAPGDLQARRVDTRSSAPAYLWPVVVVVAALMAVVSIRDFRRAMPTMLDNATAAAGVAGQPRDVDLPRLRTLIEQGRLSDKEAQHYRKLDEPPPMRQPSGSQHH